MPHTTNTHHRTGENGETIPYEVSEATVEAERLLSYAMSAINVYEAAEGHSEAVVTASVTHALASKKGSFMEATPERVAEARRKLRILDNALANLER